MTFRCWVETTWFIDSTEVEPVTVFLPGRCREWTSGRLREQQLLSDGEGRAGWLCERAGLHPGLRAADWMDWTDWTGSPSKGALSEQSKPAEATFILVVMRRALLLGALWL